MIAAHHFLPPLRHEIFQRTLLLELFVSLNERQLFLSAFFRWKGALRSLDPLEAPLGDMIGL